MEKTINGYTYENGRRIIIQRIIYNKSDDLLTLAELYRQHEALLKIMETDSAETISEEKLQDMNAQKMRLESKIKEQQTVVDGYDLANAASEQTATPENNE